MRPTSPITVYLADDHDIVLRGIASIISLDPELHIVGCTNDSTRILEDLIQLLPQILVLDLNMPGLPGDEILRRVRDEPRIATRVVVFTMHNDIGYVQRALDNGAMGYVVKESASSELIKAIKTVAQGQVYLCPPFTQETLWAYREQIQQSRVDISVDDEVIYEQLTRREKEILVLVARGYTNREIAEQVGRSVRTIEKHRYNLMKKAGLRNKAELIQFALRMGLIDSGKIS